MIGHYLLTLTPEQEDRVLTEKMRPGDYEADGSYGPCLVGTACGDRFAAGRALTGWRNHGETVEARYDEMCAQFGTERINTAIRNRILTNKARRELAHQMAEVA